MTKSPPLIRPNPLRPGDKVHIVSPAGPIIEENIAPGLDILRAWGLEPVLSNSLFERRPPYDYLAGDDQTRYQALLTAWMDPDCKAIICSRGGYGTMRLLNKLPLQDLVERPRLLVGFSDITALHLYLAGQGGLATLHGPVLKSFPLHDDDKARSLHHLHQALFGLTEAPEPWANMRPLRPGRAQGPLFGGNLSLIAALIATPYCPPLDGAILVVEDIGEPDYRLDRLFTTLRLAAGEKLAGLVIGDFSDCDGLYVAQDELQDFLASLGEQFSCPVVMGAPFGHGSTNRPFPQGVQAQLDAHRGTLHFHSHAVKSP